MLHILSNDGVLSIFHVINILPQGPCICEPPQPLPDLSGLDQFVVRPPSQPPQQAVAAPVSQPPPASASQPVQQTQLFQPQVSQPIQTSQLSSGLFQPSPVQAAQASQQVPVCIL